MSLPDVITLVSALGIGSVLGVMISSILGARAAKKKMLFEARVKAYSSIVGRVFNLFLEPDITALKNDALIWAKINAILSETFLLGSPKLVELIGKFKTKVYEFHVQLAKKNDKKSSLLHKKLIPLTGRIFDQMRKDVYVTKKSAWDNSDLN